MAGAIRAARRSAIKLSSASRSIMTTPFTGRPSASESETGTM
jgi:hypothetical protein